jgi:hypothetical protein
MPEGIQLDAPVIILMGTAGEGDAKDGITACLSSD